MDIILFYRSHYIMFELNYDTSQNRCQTINTFNNKTHHNIFNGHADQHHGILWHIDIWPPTDLLCLWLGYALSHLTSTCHAMATPLSLLVHHLVAVGFHSTWLDLPWPLHDISLLSLNIPSLAFHWHHVWQHLSFASLIQYLSFNSHQPFCHFVIWSIQVVPPSQHIPSIIHVLTFWHFGMTCIISTASEQIRKA